MNEPEKKCFEFICPKYPDCETAAGSCCAMDDTFEDRTVGREECFDLPDKPLFKAKKLRFYKP